MYNLNVAYFERYAAHLMAHLVVFLEEFASVVYRRTGMSHIGYDATAHHPGYRVFRSWLELTLNAVAASAGVRTQFNEPMIQ